MILCLRGLLLHSSFDQFDQPDFFFINLFVDLTNVGRFWERISLVTRLWSEGGSNSSCVSYLLLVAKSNSSSKSKSCYPTGIHPFLGLAGCSWLSNLLHLKGVFVGNPGSGPVARLIVPLSWRDRWATPTATVNRCSQTQPSVTHNESFLMKSKLSLTQLSITKDLLFMTLRGLRGNRTTSALTSSEKNKIKIFHRLVIYHAEKKQITKVTNPSYCS